MNSFLQTFTGFHKTGYQGIEVTLEVAGMNKQHLIALLDKNDDGCSERGPDRLATLGTLLTDIC